MRAFTKIRLSLCGLLVAAASTCVFAQPAAARTSSLDFSTITAHEMQIMMAEVLKTNPKALERLAAEPEMRKEQVNNLRQLLAYATQAVKDGIAAEPVNAQELKNIRNELVAVTYDKEVNKAKPERAPFTYITEQQIAAFWKRPLVEAEFKKFLNAKVALLPDKTTVDQLAADEIAQARKVFAKINIYAYEYEQKVRAATLPKLFIENANLQAKLQQAQFLARIYSERNSDSFSASPAEITQYIAAHLAIDPEQKRAKAKAILTRALAGEDFAKLANENSEDPGNQSVDGTKQGGLYRDVSIGTMVKVFEQAALALKPGEISPNLVQSDFGFHIIKLERKGDTYDVRHILISTEVKDPENPMARAIPVDEYVRTKIEDDKEQKFIHDLVAKNKISVPDDFVIPTAAPKPVVKRPVTKKRK